MLLFFAKKLTTKRAFLILALTLVLLFSVTACGGNGEGEGTAQQGDETIIFGGYSWGSAQLHNKVARYIIENGYEIKTDEIPGETVTIWQGLVQGDVDVSMEIWIENQQDLYDKGIEEGTAVDLGVNFPDSVQGFFVPSYVVEGDPERGIEPMAPDLESVEDLPQYWELFRDPENPDKGRAYTCIAGWECEKINAQKFETYGLTENYTLFKPGTGAALASSLVAAYEKGEPWLGYYWGPTWIFGKLDLYQVKEPEYDPEVWENNKGCAYPSVRVHIVANKDFPERFPEVAEFLENYETSMDLVSEGLAYMRDNEVEAPEAAVWFLQEKEDVWTQWVPEDVAEKVKASL